MNGIFSQPLRVNSVRDLDRTAFTTVYQVYLNEDEDDVTRKKFGRCGGCNFAHRKGLWVVIPVASQRFPASVSASKLLQCVPLPNP
jgi:hypothetical protein